MTTSHATATPSSIGGPIQNELEQLAESYLTQRLFRQILGRIERLAGHPT